MSLHESLARYANLAAATAAARVASKRRELFRVWWCASCEAWHATSRASEHIVELDTDPSGRDVEHSGTDGANEQRRPPGSPAH